MATKLDLANAHFIGYVHGRYENLLDMVEEIGLTKKEWNRLKRKYVLTLRQRDIDEIDDLFISKK